MYLFNDIIVFADINEATEEKYYESTFILLGAEIKEIKDDQSNLIQHTHTLSHKYFRSSISFLFSSLLLRSVLCLNF